MPRKKKRPRADIHGDINDGDTGAATLPLNKAFAKRYELQKRRELLASVPTEALEGSGESSSEEEEEDELAELLTRRLDKGIADTLDALRRREPKIYEKGFRAFSDHEDDVDAEDEGKDGKTNRGKEVKEKASASGEGAESASVSESDDLDSDDEPVAGWDAIAEKAKERAEGGKTTLKDYVRENLLRDGRLSDSEDEEGFKRKDGRGRGHSAREGTFRDIDQYENVGDDGGHDDDDDDDDEDKGDDGDFFKKKEKTEDELAEEEKDFERFLSQKSAKAAPKAGDELLLHSYLERETMDEKDMFLRDFVLNNGWLNRGGGSAPGANDYKIEVDNTDLSKKISKIEMPVGEGATVDNAVAEESDDFEDKVDEFEHKYNFRFEEPGGTEVVSHARKIEGSMRRPDERRKAAREARRKRKQHEKLVKTEEIKHLKNVKKREIEARLLALQEAAGDGADFSGFDLDADFDPETFSRQMEAQFGDEYYEKEDGDMRELDNEDVVVASEKRMKPKVGGANKNAEDNDGDSDGDAPLREDVERLMDEYYSLDYEDIIGGTPVRFKYKKVDKDSFSMDPAQILDADDKDLNRAISLKYLAPYRSPASIPRRALKKHAKQMMKRADSGKQRYDGNPSRHASGGGAARNVAKEKERSRKKRDKRKRGEIADAEPRDTENKTCGEKQKRKREVLDDSPEAVDSSAGGEAGGTVAEPSDRKRYPKSNGEKKRKKNSDGGMSGASLPAARLAAYGL